MLKFLSKRRRSRKILLIVFVVLLAAGLVVTFTPALSGPATSDDTAVARVADEEITLKELRQALSAYGQQIAQGQGTPRVDDPSTIYALYGQQVLDNLIRQKLIGHEARRLGLEATDYEVQERVKQIFNPWPGPEQYRMRLQQSGTSPLEFEDNLRAMIAEEKLRSYVSAAVQVSPQEVEEDYKRSKTTYTIRWVDVSPDKFRDKVQIADAEVRAFFEQRKGEFRIDDEQRRARYLFIDQNKAGETIQVSDDEMRQEFNPERAIEQVRVSQIVLNIPKPAPKKAGEQTDAAQKTDPAEETKKKAEEILSRAQGAEGKPAEDFAKLAREVSEDAASKASGGDIGWVNKKDKRDTDDPLNRVFTMQQGEVSQPIRKGDKFYLLKVTDRKLPTFEESREQLLKEARVRKGYSKAVEIATEAAQKFKESKNAEAVVSEINSKYGVPVASVKETPLFAEGDTLPDIGAAPALQSAVFDLENLNDITEHTNVTGGFAIGQYVEKRDPHDPEFAEVRKKVEDRYREEKAKDLAAQQARDIAGQARTADDMKRLADAAGLKTDERAGLSGNDSVGPLVSEADRARVYALNPGEVTREPVKISGSDTYVVASLIDRKDADMGQAFQNDRKSIEDNLLSAKRGTMFQTYLAAAQKRLKDGGEIEIYQEAIAATIAKGEAPGAAQRPGAPLAPGPGSRRPRRTPQGVVPAQ